MRYEITVKDGASYDVLQQCRTRTQACKALAEWMIHYLTRRETRYLAVLDNDGGGEILRVQVRGSEQGD